MRIFYKRIVFIAIIITYVLTLLACSPSMPEKGNLPESSDFDGLTVNYIDVGQGDSILIVLPDEKSMLIDLGNELNAKNILTCLEQYKISKLDFLVLTHPDEDHIGGAKEVLSKINVSTVYIPDIRRDDYNEIVPVYALVVEQLKLMNTSFIVSENYKYIKGEDYIVAFLNPDPMKQSDSVYRDFHLAIKPTEEQKNDLSPIIYLEYAGARFLFTGDCGINVELNLLKKWNAGIIKNAFSSLGVNVNLENIDFLKVAHHGSAKSTCYQFLELIKPKNAIISVGGTNIHGHPSTETLERFENLEYDYKLWRTDVDGNISVLVSPDGEIKIETSISK